MTLGAGIVETRIDKLRTAIPAHMQWLPPDTPLYVFGNKETAAIQREFPCHFIELTVDLAPGKYFQALNHVMTREAFWNVFTEDRVLIFQHDSGILRHGIEEFYEWDYIGAPFGPAYPFVGNGGFSLRNPRAMAHICRELHHSPYLPEDVFLPTGCDMLGYKLAPITEAVKFSCEIHFILGTFGYHAIDRYLTPAQTQQIRTQYDTVTIPVPSAPVFKFQV